MPHEFKKENDNDMNNQLNFMIGAKFTDSQVEKIAELNDFYEGKSVIAEVYGSVPLEGVRCARPIDRLPDFSLEQVASYINRLHDIDVTFNWTMNNSCFGSLTDFHSNVQALKTNIYALEDIGVDRITVSDMLIAETVFQYFDGGIEISTIQHAYSVNQLKYYASNKIYANKICANIMKNRDLKFLAAFNNACIKNNIRCELLVNEFCLFGCPYRMSCYNIHSHTDVNRREYGFYPLGRCNDKRYAEPWEWIKARAILPQHLRIYQERTGISDFKISGRTHPESIIMKQVEWYMQEDFDGNLLDLWTLLENINQDENEQHEPKLYIDTKEVADFIKYTWLDKDRKDDCDLYCDYGCNKCKNLYEVMRDERRSAYNIKLGEPG